MDIANPDKSQEVKNSDSYNVGYFIGSHFLIIIGLILFSFAYSVHKKIKNRQGNEVERDINEIGKS